MLRSLSSADRDLLADAERAAARIGDLLARAVPQSVELMALWADDSLRAQAYDPDGVQPMWCEDHDQDTRQCDPAWLCTGVPYHPGADPAGEAAVAHLAGRPKAAEDLGEVRQRLRTLVRLAAALAATAEEYSFRQGRGAAGGEPEWCRSCLRLQRCEPIAVHSDGRPRYAGLCRWCGGVRAAEGVLPPLTVLRARHEGRKVTDTMMRQAVAAERSKGRKGKRR